MLNILMFLKYQLNNMIEKIEERVRNMMNPFYTVIQLINENSNGRLSDENLLKFIKSKNMISSMETSITYLIDMSKIIDENLPKDFDINEILDKSKYYNKP